MAPYPRRRCGSRRRRRSWAGGASSSAPRSRRSRITTASFVGLPGMADPERAENDRHMAEAVGREVGGKRPHRMLGGALKTLPQREVLDRVSRDDHLGESDEAGAGVGGLPDPGAHKCRITSDVADAGVHLRQGDRKVRHGASLRGTGTWVTSHKRHIHGARWGAWISSRSMCFAVSRSATSASFACGSPMCSGSSSRWRSRPLSWRTPSRRGSALTARPSRA